MIAEAWIPFVVFGGFAAAFGLIALIAWQMRRKRRRELGEQADRLGLAFDPEKDEGLAVPFQNFGCFQTGRSRAAYNRMAGEWNGRPCVMFDYRYTTGHGKNRRTNRVSAVMLDTGRPLVPVAVRREHWFDRVKAWFGYEDIDFDEDPEFSKACHVSSPQPEAARAALGADLRDILRTGPDYRVETHGTRVVVCSRRRLKPADFAVAAEYAETILALLPPSQPPPPPR